MKIVFRVDADAKMGVGHLMRCLALAQTMSKRGVKVLFAVRKSTARMCLARNDWVGDICLVPDDVQIRQEPLWLTNLVASEWVDLLCIDGYQFNLPYRQALFKIDCKHLCFDDVNDLEALPTNLVINSASNATSLGYQETAPNAIHCLGDKFRILRQEFLEAPEVEWLHRTKLCLVFGGSDPANITLPLLEALEVTRFDDTISVVTGPAYSNIEALQAFIFQTGLDIEHLHDCQHLADLFTESRLTVSAAGGSQFEILACGSPAILVVVADNQVNATEQAINQHWCEMYDARNEFNPLALAQHIKRIWHQEERLIQMSKHTGSYSDRHGTERVLEAIFKLVERQPQ